MTPSLHRAPPPDPEPTDDYELNQNGERIHSLMRLPGSEGFDERMDEQFREVGGRRSRDARRHRSATSELDRTKATRSGRGRGRGRSVATQPDGVGRGLQTRASAAAEAAAPDTSAADAADAEASSQEVAVHEEAMRRAVLEWGPLFVHYDDDVSVPEGEEAAVDDEADDGERHDDAIAEAQEGQSEKRDPIEEEQEDQEGALNEKAGGAQPEPDAEPLNDEQIAERMAQEEEREEKARTEAKRSCGEFLSRAESFEEAVNWYAEDNVLDPAEAASAKAQERTDSSQLAAQSDLERTSQRSAVPEGEEEGEDAAVDDKVDDGERHDEAIFEQEEQSEKRAPMEKEDQEGAEGALNEKEGGAQPDAHEEPLDDDQIAQRMAELEEEERKEAERSRGEFLSHAVRKPVVGEPKDSLPFSELKTAALMPDAFLPAASHTAPALSVAARLARFAFSPAPMDIAKEAVSPAVMKTRSVQKTAMSSRKGKKRKEKAAVRRAQETRREKEKAEEVYAWMVAMDERDALETREKICSWPHEFAVALRAISRRARCAPQLTDADWMYAFGIEENPAVSKTEEEIEADQRLRCQVRGAWDHYGWLDERDEEEEQDTLQKIKDLPWLPRCYPERFGDEALLVATQEREKKKRQRHERRDAGLPPNDCVWEYLEGRVESPAGDPLNSEVGESGGESHSPDAQKTSEQVAGTPRPVPDGMSFYFERMAAFGRTPEQHYEWLEKYEEDENRALLQEIEKFPWLPDAYPKYFGDEALRERERRKQRRQARRAFGLLPDDSFWEELHGKEEDL